jgi:hypothetical protein
MGTAEHPSLSQQGNDGIEKYETPHNMKGRNRLVRFGYALFGRPGAQPFYDGPDAWEIVAILTINALMVMGVRVHWEVTSTRTLQRQLVELQSSGKEIEIDFQWFGEPVGERLKTWGIPFRAVRRGQLQNGPELMSVVAGYPGGIHYRVIEDQ